MRFKKKEKAKEEAGQKIQAARGLRFDGNSASLLGESSAEGRPASDFSRYHISRIIASASIISALRSSGARR